MMDAYASETKYIYKKIGFNCVIFHYMKKLEVKIY